MEKEKIIYASIKYAGDIYTGYDHAEAVHKCMETYGKVLNTDLIVEGFITSSQRFVDREEAYQVALKAGQVVKEPGVTETLISEELHLGWLKDKDEEIKELKKDLFRATEILAEGRDLINKYEKALASVPEYLQVQLRETMGKEADGDN